MLHRMKSQSPAQNKYLLETLYMVAEPRVDNGRFPSHDFMKVVRGYKDNGIIVVH